VFVVAFVAVEELVLLLTLISTKRWSTTFNQVHHNQPSPINGHNNQCERRKARLAMKSRTSRCVASSSTFRLAWRHVPVVQLVCLFVKLFLSFFVSKKNLSPLCRIGKKKCDFSMCVMLFEAQVRAKGQGHDV
jgi:hypothetical protein